MEERKGKRHLQGMRNVLLAFAFCFICTLCFGTVRAQASVRSFDYGNSSYTIDVSDDLLTEYPYIYIEFDSYSAGTYYVYLTDKKVYSASDKGNFVSNESRINWKIYTFAPYTQRDFVISSEKVAFNSGEWVNCSKLVFDPKSQSGSYLFGGSTEDFIYSNTNIQYAEYDSEKKEYTVKSDSFFIPSLGVSIKMVQELPAGVISQTKVILPIAVSCLALLVGCLTLLPRLKVFLG